MLVVRRPGDHGHHDDAAGRGGRLGRERSESASESVGSRSRSRSRGSSVAPGGVVAEKTEMRSRTERVVVVGGVGEMRPWRISQDGVRACVDVVVAGVGYLL